MGFLAFDVICVTSAFVMWVDPFRTVVMSWKGSVWAWRGAASCLFQFADQISSRECEARGDCVSCACITFFVGKQSPDNKRLVCLIRTEIVMASPNISNCFICFLATESQNRQLLCVIDRLAAVKVLPVTVSREFEFSIHFRNSKLHHSCNSFAFFTVVPLRGRRHVYKESADFTQDVIEMPISHS